MAKRQNFSTDTPTEETGGYSRAVRVGDIVHIAGTAAMDSKGEVQAPGDMYGQCVYVFDKIQRALEQAGASLADVVRTRAFVTDISQGAAFSRAHKERFDAVRPVTALYGITALATPGMMVEIEAEAIIGAGG